MSAAVVRLPTAAKRRPPSNFRNRACREAVRQLPQFTGEYLYANQREALKWAEAFQRFESTPELRLAVAMARTLTDEQRAAAKATLAREAETSHAAQSALVALATLDMTYGESADLAWALDRLSGEGVGQ